MESRLGFSVFLVLFIAWDVHAQFAVNCNATGAGRFANPADPTCRNYTLCVYDLNNNSFASYDYVCSPASVFNPASRQCTAAANYVCNTIPVITTPAPIPAPTPTPALCIVDGFIANPNSADCSSYIQCVNIGGTFSVTILTCPVGTFYNPISTLCEQNYVCITPFTCTAAGRYANPNDPTCQTYFLCVLANNGTFVDYQYTCPTTSVFSPTSRLCTTTYICP